MSRWDKLVESQRSKREQYLAELRKLDVNANVAESDQRAKYRQAKCDLVKIRRKSLIINEKIRTKKKSVNGR